MVFAADTDQNSQKVMFDYTIDQMEQAVKQQPRDIVSQQLLASLLYRVHTFFPADYPNAIVHANEVFARVVELSPERHQTRVFWAQNMLFSGGDYYRAKSIMREALALAPSASYFYSIYSTFLDKANVEPREATLIKIRGSMLISALYRLGETENVVHAARKLEVNEQQRFLGHPFRETLVFIIERMVDCGKSVAPERDCPYPDRVELLKPKSFEFLIEYYTEQGDEDAVIRITEQARLYYPDFEVGNSGT
jgi:hypothetical protein